MGDRIWFDSPLGNYCDPKILTRRAAFQHPESYVIGTDLSPIQPQLCVHLASYYQVLS